MTGEALNANRPPARSFPHRMLSEIYEQPQAIRETIQRNVAGDDIFPTSLRGMESTLATSRKIIIAASGSSRNAGLAGEIMIEDMAGVPVDVEYASEYCNRSTHAGGDPIVMVITQSGETVDTIAAQREALNRGTKTVAISNAPDSTISREASATLITYAAPERAVPATKSFTAQLTILYLFSLFLAHKSGRMDSETVRSHLNRLGEVPADMERCLGPWDAQAAGAARAVQEAKAFLYLGRGIHYAIAREGALKLKEISYFNAEGLPAGELRHGPNALVDENLPVVVLATRDTSDPGSVLRYEKTLGVLEYVKSSSGKAIAIANEGDREILSFSDRVLFVPPIPELLLPLLEVVPLQFFAYHFAVLKGCDVDHPRNLVKAVVTE
jgi:glucosamine--fructose-6-phosphate aminotransferase (isomerizing)